MDIIAAIPRQQIAYVTNGKLHKMEFPEKESELLPLLKRFEGHPLGVKNICCVQVNEFEKERNYLITICQRLNIEFLLVKGINWVKFHGLIKAKETGVNYETLSKLDDELRRLRTHLSIEKNVKNHEVETKDAIYLLDTNEKLTARKKLCDNYIYLSKTDLEKAIKEAEKESVKVRKHELVIRKNRHKDYANKIYIKSLIGDSETRINKVQKELGIDLKGFFYQNHAITPAELRKLFKLYNLKPLTLAECDAVLLLLYQMNS